MTTLQTAQMLTGMARKAVEKEPELRLKDWMAIRGVSPKDLAAEIDSTEASISRWANGDRTPTPRFMRKLEKFFGVERGGLYDDPVGATPAALLSGLDSDKQQEALNFIAFLKRRK